MQKHPENRPGETLSLLGCKRRVDTPDGISSKFLPNGSEIAPRKWVRGLRRQIAIRVIIIDSLGPRHDTSGTRPRWEFHTSIPRINKKITRSLVDLHASDLKDFIDVVRIVSMKINPRSFHVEKYISGISKINISSSTELFCREIILRNANNRCNKKVAFQPFFLFLDRDKEIKNSYQNVTKKP